MRFVDQAEIMVVAGSGGNGCSAMHKPPSSRYARRSGGDGGDGGDVVLVAEPQLATLLDFQFQHEFRAQRGQHGRGNTRTGTRGADCLVRIPVGTQVYDAQAQQLLRDFVTPHERLPIARGGAGGIGNANAPRATPGQPGASRRLRLELKLIADVGIVGFPNAGKSSLLRQLSTAHPKVAAYPFTTRAPVLGVVAVGEDRSFVACDIPGLIEGAHQGRGLGTQFLRHIQRTRLLLHVVDIAAVDGRDPAQDVVHFNEELGAYSASLHERPQVIVANKMDLPQAQANLERFRALVREPVWAVSCARGEGIPELIQATWQRLQHVRAAGSPQMSKA